MRKCGEPRSRVRTPLGPAGCHWSRIQHHSRVRFDGKPPAVPVAVAGISGKVSLVSAPLTGGANDTPCGCVVNDTSATPTRQV